MKNAATGTMRFDFEVEGLEQPVTGDFRCESPDYSVGYSGGWFLEQAEIELADSPDGQARVWTLDREDFLAVFGREALQVAEENACDFYEAAREDAEIERWEAYQEVER